MAQTWVLIGIFAAFAVGTLALMWTRMDRLDAKIDAQGASLGARIDALGTKIDAQGARIDTLIDAVAGLTVRIANLEDHRV
ncbi:MAG: hypothetical protein M1522_08755 [Actinobacteria bacterium]|nr:hypothetical protein [Actinomycetota bacterium]